MTAIIEWAIGSPWWAFFFFAVALTTVENIVKIIFKKKVEPSDKWEDTVRDKLDDIYELKVKLQTTETKLMLANQEIERYKQMYEELRGTDSSNEWEARRRRTEHEAGRARDFNGRGSSNPFDFEDIMRAQEAMRRQQGTHRREQPTWEEIKATYRRDMKAHHPDTILANGGSPQDVAKATTKAQKINEQYNKDKERYKR